MSTGAPADRACPRLIEVALPIREISAEAARDKSLRHGHLSTLHLWWARRPLAACRAIVFASLVPDPDDERCPPAFRGAVDRLLRTHVPEALRSFARGRENLPDPDPYRPYDGVEDTPRNRLLAFVARWSPEAVAFEAGRSPNRPKPEQLLDDRSLVKWEASDPENPQGREVLRVARELVLAAHGGSAPRVLDPFAGGGAIPLEAGRLGAKAVANDYNPVAALILRAGCELAQRYGVPGRRTVAVDQLGTRTETEIDVPNVLCHDVESWTRRVLEEARARIGNLYPAGADGRTVAGYLWARTVSCFNPACRAEMPLLRSLLVCDRPGKRVALTMGADAATRTLSFGVARGAEVRDTDGTMLTKGNVRCPFCRQVTPAAELRSAGCSGRMGERMVAVIVESRDGKGYRAVEESDLEAFRQAAAMEVERPSELIRPEVTGSEERVANRGDITVHLYGMKTWGSLYNPRQLLAMQTFVACLREALAVMEQEIPDRDYRRGLALYLGLWVSRNSMRMCTVGRWNSGGENIETPFDSARLPMKWDYPEANPFSGVSGGFANQLDWILWFLRRESTSASPAEVLRGDGAHLPLADGACAVVVTDPPYFDEAAYADLSDFFYVWLKRALGPEFPEVFATPQSPKQEEATALRHRHRGDAGAADAHFRVKLAQVFTEARRVCDPRGIVSVIFAHQAPHAWAALVHSLFSAGLTIDATWPVEMERKSRPRGLNSAALETSITVVCRTRVAGSAAGFREVRREVEAAVAEAVKRFWGYGFRGADLVVACYGPAVGVFGRYERVERADGTPVEVPELLDLARRAALDAIAGEFRGDGLSTLYYVWANLYGISEQAWDDARLVVQIGGAAEGLTDAARDRGVFVLDGSSCRLALLSDRAAQRGLGMEPDAPLVDMLHRAMALWKAGARAELVRYLAERDLFQEPRFWKLAQALFEVFPREAEDWKLVAALLAERETLRAEARATVRVSVQGTLFDATEDR